MKSKYITSQLDNFSDTREEIFTVKGFFKNGEKHGTFYTYYANGNLFKKEKYKNGIKEGLSEEFHDNGNRMFTTNYKNGKTTGVWKQYYNTGKLREERVYEYNKLLSAVVTEWYDNGNKKNSTSYIYINDEKIVHGYVNRYYENGEIQLSSYYTEGKPDKKWIGYFPNGNVKYIIIYKNSKFISHTTYDENGKIITD